MALISLKWFGGMVPRMGEQHLPPIAATDAQNTNLYSGELRPMVVPALAHVFPEPTADDFKDPPDPPKLPPPPPGCIAVAITVEPTAPPGPLSVGDIVTLTVENNADATPPTQYQWYENGNAIVGAIEASYTFTLEEGYSHSRYQVSVQNPCGSALSDEVLLGLVVSPN